MSGNSAKSALTCDVLAGTSSCSLALFCSSSVLTVGFRIMVATGFGGDGSLFSSAVGGEARQLPGSMQR